MKGKRKSEYEKTAAINPKLSKTLTDVFGDDGETKAVDIGASAYINEKNAFLRSLEDMTQNDIASYARTEKKKKRDAFFFLRILLLLVCVAVFAVSLYKITDRIIQDVRADKLIGELQTAVGDREVPRMNQTKKPTPGLTPMQAVTAGSDRGNTDQIISVDYDSEKKRLENAKQINEDVYGWIRIKGTVINYPILQGKDNDYYLYRDINREDNKSGSIFADFRMSKQLADNYNAIFYGHCMSSGTMFRAIKTWYDDYESRDSVADTMEIEIITEDGVYVYEVFSAYRSEGTHFITASFGSEKEYLKFLKDIRYKSVLRRRVPYTASSKIVTLVTCTNVISMPEERYVLHGILKKVIKYG